MRLLTIFATVILFFSSNYSGKIRAQVKESLNHMPKLLTVLPEGCNAANGAAMDKDGNIIITIPNHHNNYLVRVGELSTPDPKKIIKLNATNEITDWYIFKESDKLDGTGKINPKDCDFGPDNNLYVIDGQGRLVRININDNEATDMDVLVEGFNFSNGLVWNNDILFVSESILERHKASDETITEAYVLSGVYAFSFEELQHGTIKLSPFSKEDKDIHLIETFRSSYKIGVGADGVATDEQGNLYTAIFEDGIIYKTQFDSSNNVIETKLFAMNKSMKSADGIVYDPISKKIFVADLINNAIHAIDMEGNVNLLHKNGDSNGADGSLEAPVDLVIRGRELIILNWDGNFGVNEVPDKPFTISVIKLQKP